MRKVRKFRMFDKYNEDLWGNFKYKMASRWRKIILKVLYRKRLLWGHSWKEKIDRVKVKKIRRGFGRHHSIYKSQLWSKQKIQCFYHLTRDYQLKKFVWWTKRQKGIPEDTLAGLLESRVLTILYRTGFLTSMREGHQFLIHHGVMVEGRYIRKPNFTLLPGQVVELKTSDCLELAKLRKKLAPGFPKGGTWDFLGRIQISRQKVGSLSFRDYIYPKDLYSKSLKRLEYEYDGSSPEFLEKCLESRKKPLPGYLEISYKLKKIMLVYRPKAEEVEYPFQIYLREVLSHYG